MTTTFTSIADDALGTGDLTDVLAALRSREVSAGELAEAARNRIRASQTALNAVVCEVDAAGGDGPFAGIPSVLKDNLDLAGHPTRYGSRAVPDTAMPSDSAFTADLRALGFGLHAKTTLPEFGLTASTEPLLTGPTRNPWRLDRSTGGSSGGSAALVAAAAVPLAHANDGGGSIRIPAACCGLVGLKPSQGRLVDSASAEAMPIPIATEGVLTRSVRDTALFYSEIEKFRPLLPPIGHVQGPGAARLRIGFVDQSLVGHPISPEVAETVRRTAELCDALGHQVTEVAFPFDNQLGKDFLRYWAALAAGLTYGGGRLFGRGFRADLLEPFTGGLTAYFRTIATGVPISLWRMRRFGAEYARQFEQFDVLLSPVLSTPPPAIGYLAPDEDFRAHLLRLLRYASFTAVQNISGAPAISLPLGRSAEGTPIGVQAAGRFGSDAMLLGLAYELEAAAPWPTRPGEPDVSR